MTEENEEQASEDLCGMRLKKAREELSIPLATVSKELHLDEAKVEALERNEFDILGAPVFAKGHLRKYSQMVKVDVEQILYDYHQLTRTDGLPPVVSDRKPPSLPKSPTPWIIAAVVVLLALAGWFGWQFFLAQKSDDATPASVISPTPVSEAVVLPSSQPDRLPLSEVIVAPADQPDVEVAEETAVPVQDTPSSNAVSLQLSFRGDCWTEVTDASGDRLFFDLGSAGDQVTLEGAAPVSVLLGNAGNVSLVVDGRDYQIASADRNGDTARFTLYGS